MGVNHQGDAGKLQEWLALAMHGQSRRWQQLNIAAQAGMAQPGSLGYCLHFWKFRASYCKQERRTQGAMKST